MEIIRKEKETKVEIQLGDPVLFRICDNQRGMTEYTTHGGIVTKVNKVTIEVETNFGTVYKMKKNEVQVIKLNRPKK